MPDRTCFPSGIPSVAVGQKAIQLRAEKSPSHVKSYDCPELREPSSLVIIVGLWMALAVAFCLYQTLFPAPAKAAPGRLSLLRGPSQMRAVALRDTAPAALLAG